MAETLWYSLAEAAKATRIPRGRLDHACRVGRLPYRRSETGARLLAQGTVDNLRKQGLTAFPRPYDPMAVAPPEEAAKQPDRPGPAERIGLLAEPSPEIVKAKEKAEAAKLKVEEQKASLELAQIGRDLRAVHDEMAAERQAEAEARRAEREAEAECRRQEAERQRQDARARQDFERRKAWLSAQLELALSEASRELGIFGIVPSESRQEAKERIARELVYATADLSPEPSAVACEKARKKVIDRALAPYRLAHTIQKALPEVPKYLDRLYEDGYISLCAEDREFLAKRLQPRLKARLEKQAQARSSQLTEAEALELVRDAVDHELKLA